MLVAQKEASTDEPGVNDLFTVGTVASILQMLKLPDGTVKVLVEGLQRARISALSDNGEHFSAKAEYLDSPAIDEREQEVLFSVKIGECSVSFWCTQPLPEKSFPACLEDRKSTRLNSSHRL